MKAHASELVHIWHRCHHCGVQPIPGRRFECQICPAGPNNDLCEACHALLQRGEADHPVRSSRDAGGGGATRHVFRPVDGRSRDEAVHWLATPWREVQAPVMPDRWVVRPEFRSGLESFFGSYGFVVTAEDGGAPVLLTALHVMDELIRRYSTDCSVGNAAYTGRELAALVTEVQMYDAFAPNWMVAELDRAGPMLILPQARLPDEEPYSQQDIAAFRVERARRVRSGRLASTSPQIGDPIWLAANCGRSVGNAVLPAIVVEITERTFVFRFGEAIKPPPFTSGAPLLDRNGGVVGINVGAGMLDGLRLGHGNQLASIRRHLGWSLSTTGELAMGDSCEVSRVAGLGVGASAFETCRVGKEL
jgi:Trypsin-like peptidase domain